jgi:hypothetical protein
MFHTRLRTHSSTIQLRGRRAACEPFLVVLCGALVGPPTTLRVNQSISVPVCLTACIKGVFFGKHFRLCFVDGVTLSYDELPRKSAKRPMVLVCFEKIRPFRHILLFLADSFALAALVS